MESLKPLGDRGEKKVAKVGAFGGECLSLLSLVYSSTFKVQGFMFYIEDWFVEFLDFGFVEAFVERTTGNIP